MNALWLGCVDYTVAWHLQRDLAALRAERAIGDVLLLLEHRPVITLGRAADPANVLAAPERLRQLGVAVQPIDRGGDVTYHGPGQLVGYPICLLTDHRPDLHWFLREMEACLIDVLGCFGVAGRRLPPHTGVWVGDRKVAAIGIKVSRWVTTHGFALNVAPDLDNFRLIVPCGIREYGVTSVCQLTGRPVEVGDALAPTARAFAARFGAGGARPEPDWVSGEGRELVAGARLVGAGIDDGARAGYNGGA